MIINYNLTSALLGIVFSNHILTCNVTVFSTTDILYCLYGYIFQKRPAVRGCLISCARAWSALTNTSCVMASTTAATDRTRVRLWTVPCQVLNIWDRELCNLSSSPCIYVLIFIHLYGYMLLDSVNKISDWFWRIRLIRKVLIKCL